VVEEEGANLSVGEVSSCRSCCAQDLALLFTALPGQLGSSSGEGKKTGVVFLPTTNLPYGNSAFGYYCESFVLLFEQRGLTDDSSFLTKVRMMEVKQCDCELNECTLDSYGVCGLCYRSVDTRDNHEGV
jgi:hypothetical protein